MSLTTCLEGTDPNPQVSVFPIAVLLCDGFSAEKGGSFAESDMFRGRMMKLTRVCVKVREAEDKT